MIFNHDKLGNGKCTITITDKETGEIILKTDAFLMHYEATHERQPVHMLGRYGVVEEYVSQQFSEINFKARVLPSEEEKVEEPKSEPVDMLTALTQLMKALEAGSYNSAPGQLVDGSPLQIESLESVFCGHVWKRYEGFTDVYDYCEKCNEKRK